MSKPKNPTRAAARLAVFALRKTLKTLDKNEESGVITDADQRQALADIIHELEDRAGMGEAASMVLPFPPPREDA